MKFTYLDLKFYRLRKIPSLQGVEFKQCDQLSIHTVINKKVDYDPFYMKKKGTSKHNKMNLFRSKYRSYKFGTLSGENFLHWLNLQDGYSKYYQKLSKIIKA